MTAPNKQQKLEDQIIELNARIERKMAVRAELMRIKGDGLITPKRLIGAAKKEETPEERAIRRGIEKRMSEKEEAVKGALARGKEGPSASTSASTSPSPSPREEEQILQACTLPCAWAKPA